MSQEIVLAKSDNGVYNQLITNDSIPFDDYNTERPEYKYHPGRQIYFSIPEYSLMMPMLSWEFEHKHHPIELSLLGGRKMQFRGMQEALTRVNLAAYSQEHWCAVTKMQNAMYDEISNYYTGKHTCEMEANIIFAVDEVEIGRLIFTGFLSEWTTEMPIGASHSDLSKIEFTFKLYDYTSFGRRRPKLKDPSILLDNPQLLLK